MIAARRFDLRHGRPVERVYGCVTTGEVWQFLRLTDVIVLFRHIYISHSLLLLL